MKLTDLHLNENNPRSISEAKFERLKASITEFEKMMELRPIVVDEQGVVLGGNMRTRALQALGYEDIPDNWVKRAEGLSEEEKRRFVIEDNVPFGEWDWDMLFNEWDTEELKAWGLEPPVWDEPEEEGEAKGKLTDKFVIPPFTVLDTRQGYWKERKQYWRQLIGDNGESREGTLAKDCLMSTINNGVSLLDPVLAEIMCKWFGVEGGKAFDNFAGDTVFGYVASALGMRFTGIELRQEQADYNNERTKTLGAKYICDDGCNVLKHIEPATQDLFFSCPPYFDIEVYSDLPNDASNQKSYLDFMQIISTAFANAIKCLKEDRFAVVVCGDIRDERGCYRRFPDDIKDIFLENGCVLYNELILVDAVGTARLRCNQYMKTRKVVKVHQNVLVFYKGELKNIKTNFKPIEYESKDLEPFGVDK